MAARELAERLLLALDLYDAGEALMIQRLRRELPGASDDEIERRLQAWRQRPPGAEHGDAVGRASSPSRRFG